MKTLIKKLLLGLLLMISAVLILLVFYQIIGSFRFNQKVQLVASYLHVSPTQEAIKKFVHCDIAATGRSQPEIDADFKEKLGSVSSYGNGLSGEVDYFFANTELIGIMNNLEVLFDEDGRATKRWELIAYDSDTVTHQFIKCDE